MTTLDILKAAKLSAPALAKATTIQKNDALAAMAQALEDHSPEILAANELDMEAAKSHLSVSMLDRLSLNQARIKGMADGIRQVIGLPDPVGQIRSRITRPNGIVIDRVGVAMGVIAIVYESRPNVTSDAAALAVKAGSACVLRSGRDAFRSADAIVRAMQSGLEKAGLPAQLVQLVQDTSRQSVTDLMEAVGYVDLLIPGVAQVLLRHAHRAQKCPVSRPAQASATSMWIRKPIKKRPWIS